MHFWGRTRGTLNKNFAHGETSGYRAVGHRCDTHKEISALFKSRLYESVIKHICRFRGKKTSIVLVQKINAVSLRNVPVTLTTAQAAAR